MITLMILAAALLIGVALMNEYGWADLTGKTRNSLVFETRNKNYGAYEIREKYSNRLLIAFFGSLAFITLAAFTPKLFPNTKTEVPGESHPKGPVIIAPKEKEEKKDKETVFENKKTEPATPKKKDISTVAVPQPKPSFTQQLIDTTEKPKNAIVSNITHKGDSTLTAYTNPATKPGKGGSGECLDCPPPVPPVLEAPEVTKQAEFDYIGFFRKNLQIPREVYDMGLTGGKIYVGFVVDEEGNVTNVKIKRGLTPVLDDEVKRVASIMPKWKPAQFNENNVKVRMVIPVNIVLNN